MLSLQVLADAEITGEAGTPNAAAKRQASTKSRQSHKSSKSNASLAGPHEGEAARQRTGSSLVNAQRTRSGATEISRPQPLYLDSDEDTDDIQDTDTQDTEEAEEDQDEDSSESNEQSGTIEMCMLTMKPVGALVVGLVISAIVRAVRRQEQMMKSITEV